MMRFLPTYHTVELMRAGASPTEATHAAIKRITDKGYSFDGGLVALARNGEHGAIKQGWEDNDFHYAVRNASGAQQIRVSQTDN